MSDQSSHDSSLETTNSPSIDMDNAQLPPPAAPFKAEAHPFGDPAGPSATLHNSSHNLLGGMHSYDDLLLGGGGLNAMNAGLHYGDNLLSSNPMDFLMMDFAANQGLSSLQGTSLLNPHTLHRTTAVPDLPLDAIPSPVLDAMNATPQLNALTQGLLPNTPHLPPLNIDANSHPSGTSDAHAYLAGVGAGHSQSAPNMPSFEDRDFQQFMSLIQQNTTVGAGTHGVGAAAAAASVSAGCTPGMASARLDVGVDYLLNNPVLPAVDPVTMQPQITPIPPSVSTALETATKHCRKRKQLSAAPTSPPKKRKLNETKKERVEKRKRGRPRKESSEGGGAVSIKKEHKQKSPKGRPKGRKRKKAGKKGKQQSEEDYDLPGYLKADYGRATENYVGIRTADGEVRIQIPPSSALKTEEAPDGNGLTIKHESRVKFEVFGNACSDRIEDILQPKKRTRYVRGLSEEEKKTRRREQNRNAAARSRARKNAMISKVIQLHQENMGLRAFVAENIGQTKLLRDELERLNRYIQSNQMRNNQMQNNQRTQPLQQQRSIESASVAHPPRTPPRPPTPPSATSSREEQSASIGTATTNTSSSSVSLFDIINGQ